MPTDSSFIIQHVDTHRKVTYIRVEPNGRQVLTPDMEKAHHYLQMRTAQFEMCWISGNRRDWPTGIMTVLEVKSDDLLAIPSSPALRS